MDIDTVASYRFATTEADLALNPGEKILAGGTWLMSEPQPHVSGFVDISRLPWPALEVTEAGLRIGAPCTIADLVAFAAGTHAIPCPSAWRAVSIIPEAANALLASFKIWNTATVVGNICQSFAAASMVSLAVALDGVALIRRASGDDEREDVARLITDNGSNSLAPGDVVRYIELPARALRSHAALHKIALAELGRSGAVVSGRVSEANDECVIAVTAATRRPVLLRYQGTGGTALPSVATVQRDVANIAEYFTDPLGDADWRHAVSVELARRLRDDLAARLADGRSR